MQVAGLKNRLLHLLAATDGGTDPVTAAREVLALEHCSPTVAFRLLRPVVESDPRLELSPESVSLVNHARLDPAFEQYAVVDVETTGLASDSCRMTEIAVVVVEGNGEVVEEFSSLINPGRPIPAPVVELTGITDDMVRDAPTAERVLPEAIDLLEGRIVVAHSAGFDRRFISGELKRWGLDPLDVTWLCTKRLARRLLSGQVKSFGLDSLQRHFEITNRMRHRALGDARATARILATHLIPLARDRGCRTGEDLVALTRSRRTLSFSQRAFDRSFLDELPESPGVYRMYDDGDNVIYVGKSVRLRERVWSYFRPSAEPRQHKIARATHRIEVQTCGNELMALLEESRQIREHQPRYNRKRRSYRGYRYLKLTHEPLPRLMSSKEIKHERHRHFGPFPNPCVGRRSVQLLRDVFTLRDHSNGPFPDTCFAANYDLRVESLVDLLEGRTGDVIEWARDMASHHARRQQPSLADRWQQAAGVMEQVYAHAAQVGPDILRRNGILVVPAARDNHVLLLGVVRGRPLIEREIPRNRRGVRAAVQTFVRALDEVAGRPPEPEEVDEIRIVHGWLDSRRDDPSWVDLGDRLDAQALQDRLRSLIDDPDLFQEKVYV